MSLRLATLEEVPEIYREFQKLEKRQKYEGKPPIFGYIRKDYLERMAQSKNLYFDNNIIACVKQYKVGRKKYGISGGDWHLAELLNISSNSLSALIFFKKLLKYVIKQSRIFNEIRDDNERSIKWHLSLGFKKIANLKWSNGIIPGGLYTYDNTKNCDEKWFKEIN